MINKLSLLLLGSVALAGCQVHRGEDRPARGLIPVNQPVVSRADYVFDAAAPGGSLGAQEAARLDAWFRGLELGYGDVVSVDGIDSAAARPDVARLAGRYGLLLADGSPVTAGVIPPGAVRVVVSRTRASVPNCPNWSRESNPNFSNEMMSNFGCAVSGNLAAMIANPGDLVSGREPSGIADPVLSNKAIESYRAKAAKGGN
ncbi:CpaD family pilus assembly protein [Sphingomonas sp. LHG3443-2]|uniref:CpaD family pilus assembly protein n=1 Tax=Sphingomonas sp. LHG3443-2 TaxID=2804639 RepID=UPI003CF1784D